MKNRSLRNSFRFFALTITLLCGIFGVTKTVAQTNVTIGSGTSTNYYLPTYSYSKYSFTEQIYTAAEIGAKGTISAIAFKVSNSKTATRTVDLYMKHTSKTAFTSASNWELLSSSDKVFSGNVTFNSTGWTTITLDTPFFYDGSSNLIIGVDDNTGSGVSSTNSPRFYAYSTSTNRALRIYNTSTTNYNPASITATGSYDTYNDQIMLTMSLPTGTIAGAFTINSSGNKVYFSKGNLQYKASTGKWRFAENQYDHASASQNANISQSYNNWIDLFGWGTSGNACNTYYQPYSTNTSSNGYGPNGMYDLTGTYANQDWGVYNAISNGDNQAGLWRTLTYNEWNYLLKNRSTSSGIRFAKATVGGEKGVILLPDNWSTSYYSLHNTNTIGASFTSNVISTVEWRVIEQYGAVFLPTAGSRTGTTVSDDESYGSYWTTTSGLDYSYAYAVIFNNTNLDILSNIDRASGRSVRLVRPVQNNLVGIKAFASPNEHGQVSGGGVYQTGTLCTLTATPNTGYAFVNWKKGNTVVSTNPTYTFTVSGEETYVASFVQVFTITASASPSSSGTVTGGGVYEVGTQCTLTATANSGYAFTNWTKGGNVVSTNPSYSFTVTEAGTYVANFVVTYTIAGSASPVAGGTVIGAGTYNVGETCTLAAAHSENYYFVNWTENGNPVSSEASYSFTVTQNRTLVANFLYLDGAPTGALDGLFSVSESKSVWFSQGNLQYRASSNTWRFAANQWDFVGGSQSDGTQNVYVGNVSGSTNNNISSSYNGWIDLFSWGTSGYNHNTSYYQPWCHGDGDYYAYGNANYNLYDQTGKADWGYNKISNGGSMENYWRTLKNEEWIYLLNTRFTASGIRYAKALVNDVRGLIVLPDNWETSYFTLNNANTPDAHFSDNTITLSQWETIAGHGALFLPVTGQRVEYQYESKLKILEVFYLAVTYQREWRGVYWSSSADDEDMAKCMSFGEGLASYNISSFLNIGTNKGLCGRGSGSAVRLVRETPYQYRQIQTSASPTNGGTVTGGGIYEVGTSCTLTAIPASGYYFVNWTKNGVVVSTNASWTFPVTGAMDLVANFADINGNLTGAFSISNGVKVNFSSGNLQYQASSDTWRFAEHQWDYVGSANSNISSTNEGWIDLFGWGTSGWNSGATAYQPWSTSTSYSYYYPGGSSSNNLTGDYANADWGVYNAISNGSNTPGLWRTLTYNEWNYLLNTRTTSSGIRYAKAQVNGVNGLILLPDNWSTGNYYLSSTNTYNASYSNNIINATKWENNLEAYGAVFLPAAGYRNGTSISSVGSYGRYWSSTYYSNYYAYNVYFYGSSVSTTNSYRYYGNSVRLVCPASDDYLGINASCNPTGAGVVKGGGTYLSGTSCTLSVTGNSGYVFKGWFKNGTLVSTKPIYTFTVTGSADYEARFIQGTIAGNLTGAFSIGNNIQVNFSQGNLQYQASTNTWRFAQHQYDQVGPANSNISSTNTGWIDLFGWGTSGWNSGATAYQPWSTSSTSSDYLQNSLTGSYANADWGVNNAISNGGNQSGLWRTLTRDEWNYLLNTRTTSSGIRYAKACVSGVNGVILLPDNWNSANYALNSTNATGSYYNNNVINASTWATKFEAYGAVFLPVTGYRSSTYTNEYTETGDYWTSSYNNSSCYYLNFYNNGLSLLNTSYGFYEGHSVRLACSPQVEYYNIYTLASPSSGGVVSGGRAYQADTECTVTATPNDGWSFAGWVENGVVVSTAATYTFTVTDNRVLTANFTFININSAPVGAINGLFSVSQNQMVYFSKGNLQYKVSKWEFAANQWDYLGTSQNGSSQSVNRDLFGWGTSGYSHGATNYMPYHTNNTNSYYYAYGNKNYNLYDQTGKADWGYNRISNGGNTENTWRTLKNDEWNYVFNNRVTASGIRYAKAIVNGINGVILLPDDWSTSYYTLNNPNKENASFTVNTITSSDWALLEQHGAVFLPAAGNRSGTSVSSVGSSGGYWSSSQNNQNYAYCVSFSGSTLNTSSYNGRAQGMSVRLVRTFQTYSINATPSPAAGGEIVGQGSYAAGSECTLTATPNTGYHFVNWTEGGNEVSTNATYSFTVTGNKTLVANFSPNTYTVTLNTNGGTINSGNVTSYTYGVGATLPTNVTRTGYTFGGWYDNSSLTGTAVTAISTTATGNKTFWAKWTINSYSITATANPTAGGTVSGAGTYNYNASCTLTATAKTGYSFVKWTVSGTQVSTSATYSFTVTGNKTLVANFSPNTYTVTLNTNGGTINSGNVTSYTYGVGATLPTNVTRTGYTFGGWYDNSSLTGTAVTTISTTDIGNKTFWAKWNINSYTLTINYKYADGTTAAPTHTENVNYNATYSVTSPENTGYTPDRPVVSGKMGTANVTVNVTYAINSYTLTVNYKYANGTTAATTHTESVNYNATYSVTSPEITGYTPDQATVTGTMGTANVTVNVTYAINSYTLTVNYKYANGTTAATTHTESVNYNATYSVTSPEITGYTPDQATVTGTMGTANVTVNVTYAINSYTLTVNYKYANGTTAATTHTESVNYNATYSVTSPEITGYTPDQATVTGTMVTADVTVNVTYTINSYEITATANPTAGGTVSGANTYDYGTTATLTATASTGYHFVNWTEGGSQVSTSASYSFTVTGARTLVANFEEDAFRFINNGNWNTASNWQKGALPSSDDIVIINANCNLNQNATVTTLTVTSGYSLTIKTGYTLNVTGTLTNTTAANLIIEDGAQLITSSSNVAATVKKTIDDWNTTNWYFISSPIGNAAPSSVTGMITDTYTGNDDSQCTYDLYSLDITEELAWLNYRQHNFSLTKGMGYLYASKEGATLNFTGNIQPSNTNVTVSGLNAGFNLVGNPFTCDAYLNQNYYMLVDGNTISASATGPGSSIAPCLGVIIDGTSVTFSKTKQTDGSANNGNLELTLTQAVTNTRGEKSVQTLDNAIVSFNEGSELGKFYFGTQNANIYIPKNGKEYAIVSVEAQGEMPVCFKAAKDGQYTITVNTEEVEMGYLHLIDNIAGTDIDLLATSSYSFNAKADDYESRFRLVFSANNENQNENENDFAFISNDQLIITGEGTLEVIDVMGRILVTKRLSTTNSQLPITNFRAGVYLLRLINGENVKTQKIVVK